MRSLILLSIVLFCQGRIKGQETIHVWQKVEIVLPDFPSGDNISRKDWAIALTLTLTKLI
jgi:hypothetical protein